MELGQGLPRWLAATVGLEIFIPLAIGSNNAIWQSKVPPEQQGRVLAARDIFSTLIHPASHTCLTAGAVQYELEYCADSCDELRHHCYDGLSFLSNFVPFPAYP